MAHVGQKLAFGRVGGFGQFFGLVQFHLSAFAFPNLLLEQGVRFRKCGRAFLYPKFKLVQGLFQGFFGQFALGDIFVSHDHARGVMALKARHSHRKPAFVRWAVTGVFPGELRLILLDDAANAFRHFQGPLG